MIVYFAAYTIYSTQHLDFKATKTELASSVIVVFKITFSYNSLMLYLYKYSKNSFNTIIDFLKGS